MPKNSGRQRTRSASFPGSSEPTRPATPWARGSVDRVLSEVREAPGVVVGRIVAARQLHLGGELPRASDNLTDPPHALGVRVDDADGRQLDLPKLARLAQPVGVHRDLDIVGVGDRQGAVDDGGIPSVVLVDLQAAGAGLSLAGERGGREARRAGEDPEVRRPGGEGHEHPLEIEGGVVVEPAGDEGGHPGGQRHGHEARLDEVHVGVNPAGVAMYARS